MTKLLTTVMILSLALTACGGGEEEVLIPGSDPNCPTEGGQEYPPDQRPASTAEIEIVSPSRGEVVTGDSVQVQVTIDGACILSKSQRAIRPDTGHVHIILDGETLTQFAGDTYTIEGIRPGSHIVEAGFYAADHFDFNPPVNQKVTFKVVAA